MAAAIGLIVIMLAAFALVAAAQSDDHTPFELTATYIVGQATDVVRHYLATQAALGTIYPTPTLIPTVGPTQIESLRARWLKELESGAGFSHPLLTTLVDEMADALPTVVPAANERGWPLDLAGFSLRPQMAETTFQGVTYRLLIFFNSFSDITTRTIMFKLMGTDWLVVDLSAIDGGYGFAVALDERAGSPAGFADRNGNGYPDIAIWRYFDANTIDGTRRLLEIRPGDEIVDLIPPEIDTIERWLVDLEGDGVFEIMVSQIVNIHPATFEQMISPSYCCVAQIHYYGWTGARYEDISASLDERYWPEIEDYWRHARTVGACLQPTYEMAQMLLAYDARGALAEGWAMLQPRLTPRVEGETCDSLGSTARMYDPEAFFQWVEERIAAEAEAR